MPTGSIIWDLDDDPDGNVYEESDAHTVYPVTAYDVPRRQRP